MNANGDVPAVDHVDLIAGEITGLVQKELAPGVPNPEYSNPSHPSAKVITSFTAADFEIDEDGFRKAVLHLKDLRKDTYFRIRGTNLPCGTANQTGPAAALPSADHCSPLADALEPFAADPAVNAQKALADLWFYSNPVFVDVR